MGKRIRKVLIRIKFIGRRSVKMTKMMISRRRYKRRTRRKRKGGSGKRGGRGRRNLNPRS